MYLGPMQLAPYFVSALVMVLALLFSRLTALERRQRRCAARSRQT
jgi:hypothetical protein